MNLFLRPLAGLVLALSMTLTGLGAAWARGLPPAVGEVVICRGLTVVSVAVDATGRPVPAPHLCPDGALALFAALAGAALAAMLAIRWVAVPAGPAARLATGRGGPVARARAPPFPA